MTTSPITRAATANSRSCCAVRRSRSVSRRYLLYSLSPARTCHAFAQGTRRRIHHCGCHHRNRSAGHFRLYSDQLDFHQRMGRYTSRRRYSNWACYPQSMSANPFRASVEKAQHAAYREVAATSSSPMHSLRNLKTFSRFGARLDETHASQSNTDGESGLSQAAGISPGFRA